MSYRVTGAWLSHPGLERKHNEDSLLIFTEVCHGEAKETGVPFELRAKAGILAVADGIGGAEAGEVASRLALRNLAALAQLDQDSILDCLQDTNRELFDRSKKEPAFSQMGTTVTGIVLAEKSLFTFNVGDSRVYRINGGYLQQITEDHSLAALLTRAQGGGYGGEPTSPRLEEQHVLMQALGGRREFREITPQIVEIRLREQADFLLCSDGLTDMLTIDAIEACLGDHVAPDAALNQLKEKVMLAGAKDNLTMMHVQVMFVADPSIEATT